MQLVLGATALLPGAWLADAQPSSAGNNLYIHFLLVSVCSSQFCNDHTCGFVEVPNIAAHQQKHAVPSQECPDHDLSTLDQLHTLIRL
jgi:hypothetical protein